MVTDKHHISQEMYTSHQKFMYLSLPSIVFFNKLTDIFVIISTLNVIKRTLILTYGSLGNVEIILNVYISNSVND